MKKLLFGLITLLVLLVVLSPSLLGFSIFNLGHAIEVSTSMSAKLACSSKFITQLEDEQIVKDLASYSPAVNLVDIEYDLQKQSVKATLFGLAEAKAHYQESIGCRLIFDNTNRDKLIINPLKVSDAPWPAGEDTPHIAALIQQELDEMLRSDNERGYNSRALLVIQNGQLLAESYGPNINSYTPLLGWSMAKSVIAILLGRMEFLDMIDLNQAQLFEAWLQDERAGISLVQLLQMSSGLDFNETYAPGSDATRMLFTAPSASDIAMTSELAHKPSQYFSYSSGTTNLLSRYIHQILGNDSSEDQRFLYQKIFEPLAMANSIFEMDSSGVLVGSSYLYSSGRDWARLGLMMLNKGRINGHQIVSEKWVADAIEPNVSENDKRYGYQFWLNRGEDELRWPSLPEDAYAMMGNRKQSVMIIPSENIVLVRLGWSAGEYPMASNYRKLLNMLSH